MKSKSVLSVHATSRKRRSPPGGSMTGSVGPPRNRCAVRCHNVRLSFHSDSCASTSRERSDIRRAVISRKAVRVGHSDAFPGGLPFEKFGDEFPALLSNFGYLP